MWPMSASERARREHERWLNRALALGADSALRIPVRDVRRGGFGAMRSSSAGRSLADRWWSEAIKRADAMVDA